SKTETLPYIENEFIEPTFKQYSKMACFYGACHCYSTLRRRATTLKGKMAIHQGQHNHFEGRK
ncbi:MAG: hypothetical protein ACI382_05935, partial [Alloprevotella sp.]